MRIKRGDLIPLTYGAIPVLQPRRKKKTKKEYHCFTTKGVWKESKGELNSPELSVPASLLKESVQTIAERILHLLCHRYAKESDLKETTRYGKYHNRVFKRIAETHGLTVTMAEKTGWSETKLSDENCLSGFKIPN